MREVRANLPPGYYRQLPKLAEGPFAGYPRTLGLIWGYVAQTDSHFDPETLRRYLVAYQSIQPLTIEELWAVSITLRIVLIENLRGLVDQMTLGMGERAEANALADALQGRSGALALMAADAATGPVMSEVVPAQLAKRLQDLVPRITLAWAWLEQRLAQQSSTSDLAVTHAPERQGASNLSVRNVITSMRQISDIDGSDQFDNVSQVELHLRGCPGYGDMDFANRNLYRNAVEQLARRTPVMENDVADAALLASVGVTRRGNDPGYHLIAEGRFDFERRLGFHPALRQRTSRLLRQSGIKGYVGAMLGLTTIPLRLSFSALINQGAAPVGLIIWTLAALIPATEVARSLIDRDVSFFSRPAVCRV